MKPYYESNGITIYHGDCREVLPTLDKVDLVLTDPPYGIAYRAGRQRDNLKGAAIAGDASLEILRGAWPLIESTLMDDRHFYVFADPAMAGAVADIVQPKQHLCWDKGDQGTMGELEAGYGKAWEVILYGMKGRRPLYYANNGGRPRNILRFDWAANYDPVHPTVKPVSLLSRLVQLSSLPGETVLDPFMGSGTTLRAAKDLGRKAIGIELEERYCEIAARRLDQEVLAL